MKNILLSLVRSVPLSLVIICLGYIFVHFILKNPQKLDFTLFAFGAIPIVIFLPSVFSQSRSGALHTPKVIFRKVNTLETRGEQETEKLLPALSYVLAGLLTWVFSMAIY